MRNRRGGRGPAADDCSSWAAWTTRGRTRKIFPRADVGTTRGTSAFGALVVVGRRPRAPKWPRHAASQAARQRLAEFDSAVGGGARSVARDSNPPGGDGRRDEGVTAATEARRVVDERYRAGVIAQIEVLDAELRLLQAQLDRTRALANVRLAEARLDRALGR